MEFFEIWVRVRDLGFRDTVTKVFELELEARSPQIHVSNLHPLRLPKRVDRFKYLRLRMNCIPRGILPNCRPTELQDGWVGVIEGVAVPGLDVSPLLGRADSARRNLEGPKQSTSFATITNNSNGLTSPKRVSMIGPGLSSSTGLGSCWADHPA